MQNAFKKSGERYEKKIMIAIALTGAVFLLGPNAYAWQEIVRCDSGLFTIDQKSGALEGFDYQMVLRGNVVNWLHDDVL